MTNEQIYLSHERANYRRRLRYRMRQYLWLMQSAEYIARGTQREYWNKESDYKWAKSWCSKCKKLAESMKKLYDTLPESRVKRNLRYTMDDFNIDEGYYSVDFAMREHTRLENECDNDFEKRVRRNAIGMCNSFADNCSCGIDDNELWMYDDLFEEKCAGKVPFTTGYEEE